MKKIITILILITIISLILIHYIYPQKEVVVREYVEKLCACHNISERRICDCANGYYGFYMFSKDAKWCTNSFKVIEEPYWEEDGYSGWEEKYIIKCIFLTN